MTSEILKNTIQHVWQLRKDKKQRRYFACLACEMLPGFGRLFIHMEALARHKRAVWYTPVGMREYCTKAQKELVVIEEPTQRVVYKPAYYGKSKECLYRFPSPSIYVAKITDGTVIGALGMVVACGHILCDAYAQDEDHRTLFKFGPIKKVKKDGFMVLVDKEVQEMEEAVNLCGIASNNYYHFTMEILSRLDYVNHNEAYRSLPILIDASVQQYEQMKDLLAAVNETHPVVYVKEGALVKVHHLIHPSMNTWMPVNVSNRELFRISDNLIAASGVENIRKAAQRYMVPQTDKKIFLSRRRTESKRIRNEDALAAKFAEAGFEIVFTEDLSYAEQVALFSSAGCVVGASGAALTNIIYCHPGTVVGCFIPEDYGFCIYSTIAYLNGCKALYLDADIIVRMAYTAGDTCEVREENVPGYIAALLDGMEKKE